MNTETRQPGKFEGCDNQTLADRLHQLSLDGSLDNELGEVDGFGWYGLLHDVDGMDYIVSEDNYGFFDYTEYKLGDADVEWARLEAEYEEFAAEE